MLAAAKGRMRRGANVGLLALAATGAEGEARFPERQRFIARRVGPLRRLSDGKATRVMACDVKTDGSALDLTERYFRLRVKTLTQGAGR